MRARRSARAVLQVFTKSRSRHLPCLKPNVELNVYLLKLPFGTIQFIGSMRPKFDV